MFGAIRGHRGINLEGQQADNPLTLTLGEIRPFGERLRFFPAIP
jgi:hypothetical protein